MDYRTGLAAEAKKLQLSAKDATCALNILSRLPNTPTKASLPLGDDTVGRVVGEHRRHDGTKYTSGNDNIPAAARAPAKPKKTKEEEKSLLAKGFAEINGLKAKERYGESFLPSASLSGKGSSSVNPHACPGVSPLHQGFNAPTSDVFLGCGASETSEEQRLENIKIHLAKHASSKESANSAAFLAEHASPSLIVLAQGSGGASLDKHEIYKLHSSGAKIANVNDVIKSSASFPTVELQSFPTYQGFLTQLQLITHASFLLATQHSLSLLFSSHPRALHVIEFVLTTGSGSTPKAIETRNDDQPRSRYEEIETGMD